MSKIVKCAKGHYYDADKFDTCPHCQIREGKTPGRAADYTEAENLDDVVTVAKQSSAFSVKPPRFRRKPEVTGEIVKPPENILANDVTEEMLSVWKQTRGKGDDSLTVRYELPESGIEPVVGWLVCASGAKRGQDYRLVAGFNKIGRDRKMDIVVSDDRTVSRDTHCSVVYDRKSNETFLAPGKGLVHFYPGKITAEAEQPGGLAQEAKEHYFGETVTEAKELYSGEMVTEAKKLHSGDMIEVGTTRFIFISFCEGDRSWEEK